MSWKRSLVWTCVAALLVGTGIGVYRLTPPQPRCVLPLGPALPLHFADDGRQLLAQEVDRVHGQISAHCGPLQVWDLRTGAQVASHLEKDANVRDPVFSPEGRFYAGVINRVRTQEDRSTVERFLAVVDLTASVTREIPLKEVELGFHPWLRFSQDGRLLYGLTFGDHQGLGIWDTATGQLIHQRSSEGVQMVDISPKDALVYAVLAKHGFTNVELWDVKERRGVATLENAGPNAVFSPDGRFYVAERLDGRGAQVGNWGVWNLQTRRLEAEFKSEVVPEWAQPIISEDGRWLVMHCRSADGRQYLEVRELPTGKAVATRDEAPLGMMTFSPDGKALVLHTLQNPSRTVVLSVPGLEEMWAMNDLDFDSLRPSFSRDSRTMFAFASAEPQELWCIDIATGQMRNRVHHPGDRLITSATPDRRRLLVRHRASFRQEPGFFGRLLLWMGVRPLADDGSFIVLDTDTCRELLHLVGERGTLALLSADGRTLVTYADETARVWDVDAWKPLYAAIGVPMGLAGVIALASWLLRRRRA